LILLRSLTAFAHSGRLAPISLTIVACFVRLWGIDFGLPYAYHVDEHFYVPHAWAMGQGQIDLPDQSTAPACIYGRCCSGSVSRTQRKGNHWKRSAHA